MQGQKYEKLDLCSQVRVEIPGHCSSQGEISNL